MSTIGVWMIGFAGIAIIVIGVRFLIAPAAGARGFGLSADPGDPYLLVKGVRDVVSGLVVLALIAAGQRTTVALATSIFALIPLADCAIVRLRGGVATIAFGVHLTTAIYMWAAAALVLVG
jgi:hypothetical protein